MTRARPALAWRIALLVLLAGFLRLAHNPLVIAEAWLGLSPSPLERLFGIRGPFSGMTEASFRLAHLDPAGAMRAHPLVLCFWALVAAMILTWRFPTVRRRSDELALFAAALGAAMVNNLA